MLLLWNLSLVISIGTLGLGVIRRSWFFMLISAVTSIPIAYYFSGANNAVKYVGLMPIVLLLLANLLRLVNSRSSTRKN